MSTGPALQLPAAQPFAAVAEALRHSEDAAWRELLTRYSVRLVALARSRLFDGRLRQKLDAEDLVQSVLATFLRHHRRHEFRLESWEAVWALLFRLTCFRACKWHDHYAAQKRDVGLEKPLPGERRPDGDGPAAPGLPGAGPTPAEVAALLDTVEENLRGLSERDRRMIRLGLLGYEDEEIGTEAGSTEYRVELARKDFLALLNRLLRGDADGPAAGR